MFFLTICLKLSLTLAFTQVNIAWNAENSFENNVFVDNNQYYLNYDGDFYPTCLAHGEDNESCPSNLVCSGAFGYSFGFASSHTIHLEDIISSINSNGCLDTSSCSASDFLHPECPPANCVTAPIQTPLDGSDVEPEYCIKSQEMYRNGRAICSESLQEDTTYFSKELTNCDNQNRACDDYIPDQFFLAENEHKLLEADIGNSDTSYITSNGQHEVWEAETMLLLQQAFVKLDPVQQAQIFPLITQFETLSSLQFNDFFPSNSPSIDPTTTEPSRWPTISLPTLFPTSSKPTISPSTSEPTPMPVPWQPRECTTEQLANKFCWAEGFECKQCCNTGKGSSGVSCWDSIYTLERCCGTTYSPTPTNPTMSPSLSTTPDIVETFAPSAIPTRFPTKEPSLVPSLVPTDEPTTLEPTNAPSKEPSVNPTRNPTVEPTAAPSLAPSLAPTTDGWCINDVASDSPRRFPGGAEDCFSGGDGLSSGSVNWLIDGVSLRMTNRGLLPDTHELCIIQHGDDFEWAVVSDDGYIYPTCVQSGDSNRETTTLVPNSDGGIIPTNLGRQANQLQNQRVFSRNNYMAIECPPVQSYCSTSVINDWWGDSVEEQVTAQTGSLDALADNWRDNICLGDDLAVRYITDEGIINTCTGYDYTDTASVKSTTCAGRNTWECGFKTFNSLELPVNLSPAYPINTFRAIARALTSEDYTYPECSFNNRKYCASESNEQRVQPRYTDTSNCVTDTNHPHYDNSINSVLASIRNKHAGTNYDLCYMEDSDGYLYYTIFVEGVGYPTCVQGPATEENCQADKYYCVEEERRNWPNTVANRLLAGQVFGSLTRNNHMHNACPTLQSICQASGLTAFEQESLQPAGLEGQFDNNICLGQDGGIRIVTEEGVKPTCVGYSWDTDLMGEGSEQLKPCPAERNFMCGSLQLASGEKTYGWLTAQRGLVHTALLQEDFLHPECPYVECREC